MGTICDYLVHDHQRCDELFAHVETNVALKEWRRAEENFRLFSGALDRHIWMEEGILFPTFEKTIRGSGMPLGMLRVEHQRIRAIVNRICDALCRSDPVDFMLHTETFALLMQQHSVKEEDMLYPLLDRILGSHTTEIVCAMREKVESTIQ
ncbi:hemerythrin domain-containing protein [Noviherbaspirillum sp. UKPF54]|uniref:hemerythrin domain-containing protein n=1 Tax=Noviherbaspirillum sp. UKPF54 TaxID=2601898 RepID=UPI0011B12F6F|nr:hemerythrin domain-containing protein [Noviherbaspirillum sp. UKPF54]QDZ27687.1 hemerythrin domain-containing protein [Noviherbaspirillum sp. UKPF54]